MALRMEHAPVATKEDGDEVKHSHSHSHSLNPPSSFHSHATLVKLSIEH